TQRRPAARRPAGDARDGGPRTAPVGTRPASAAPVRRLHARPAPRQPRLLVLQLDPRPRADLGARSGQLLARNRRGPDLAPARCELGRPLRGAAADVRRPLGDRARALLLLDAGVPARRAPLLLPVLPPAPRGHRVLPR